MPVVPDGRVVSGGRVVLNRSKYRGGAGRSNVPKGRWTTAWDPQRGGVREGSRRVEMNGAARLPHVSDLSVSLSISPSLEQIVPSLSSSVPVR